MEQFRASLGALAQGQIPFDEFFGNYERDANGVMNMLCDVAKVAGISTECEFVLVIMGRMIGRYPQSAQAFDQQVQGKCLELVQLLVGNEKLLKHVIHFIFSVAAAAGDSWFGVIKRLIELQTTNPVLFGVVLDEFNESFEKGALLNFMGDVNGVLSASFAHIGEYPPMAVLAVLRMGYRFYLAEQAEEAKQQLAGTYSAFLKQVLVMNAENVDVVTRVFRDMVQFLDHNWGFCAGIVPDLIQVAMQKVLHDTPARNFAVQVLIKLMTKYRTDILKTATAENDVVILNQFLNVMTQVIATLPMVQAANEEGCENLTLDIMRDEIPGLMDKYSDESENMYIAFMQVLESMRSSSIEAKSAFCILMGWSVLPLIDYFEPTEDLVNTLLPFYMAMIGEQPGPAQFCGFFGLWKLFIAIARSGERVPLPDVDIVQALTKVNIGQERVNLTMLLRCLAKLCRCCKGRLDGIIALVMGFCETVLKLPLEADDKACVLAMFRACSRASESVRGPFMQTILTYLVESLKNPSEILFYLNCLKTFVSLASFVPQDLFSTVLNSAFGTIMSTPFLDYGLAERDMISSVISTLIMYGHPIISQNIQQFATYLLAGGDRSQARCDEVSADQFVASEYVVIESSAAAGIYRCLSKSYVDAAVEVFVMIRNLLQTQSPVVGQYVQEFIVQAEKWHDLPLTEPLAYHTVMVRGEAALWLNLSQPDQAKIAKDTAHMMITTVPGFKHDTDDQRGVMECLGKLFRYICMKTGEQQELASELSRMIFEVNRYWVNEEQSAHASDFQITGRTEMAARNCQYACGNLVVSIAKFSPPVVTELLGALASANAIQSRFGLLVMCAGVCTSTMGQNEQGYLEMLKTRMTASPDHIDDIVQAAALLTIILSAGKLSPELTVFVKDHLHQMLQRPKSGAVVSWCLLSFAIVLAAHPVPGVDPSIPAAILATIPFTQIHTFVPLSPSFTEDYIACLNSLASVPMDPPQVGNILSIGHSLLRRSSIPEETAILSRAIQQFQASKLPPQPQ